VTRNELLARLAELRRVQDRTPGPIVYSDVLRDTGRSIIWGDTEVIHAEADAALVAYIADAEIVAAYDAVDKWFA